MKRHLSALIAPLVALSACSVAGAQMTVSGAVFDGNGGPLQGTVFVSGTITVPAGQTLTISAPPPTSPAASSLLRMAPGTSIRVEGTLISDRGSGSFTTLQQTTITSLEDANPGGSGVAFTPGTWGGIVVLPGGTAFIRNNYIKYATNAIRSSGAVASLSVLESLIVSCSQEAVKIESSDISTLLVQGCTFNTNQDVPFGIPLNEIPNILSCTAFNNPGGDHVRTFGPNTIVPAHGSVVIQKINTTNQSGVVEIDGRFSIDPGGMLTLGPGVIFKLPINTLTNPIHGTFMAQGASGDPVILTSIRDDAAGGDTNGDGNASAPSPGDWRNLTFGLNSDTSALDHTIIRYAGRPCCGSVDPFPALDIDRSNPTLTNCIIEKNSGDGINGNGTGSAPARPTLTDCAFNDNGKLPATDLNMAAFPGFSGNTATGNAEGDYFKANGGLFPGAGQIRIRPSSYPGDVLGLGSVDLVVTAGDSLVFEPGVIMKSDGFGRFRCEGGALLFNGTASDPIIVTALGDDSISGDTNKDGNATPPSFGRWRGMLLTNGVAIVRHTLLRFGGRLSSPVVVAQQPNVILDSVRVDFAADRGFVLGNLIVPPDNLVAFSCNGDGLHLTSGTFDVRHATAVGCGTGILKVSWNGDVLNSISFGNAGGNFVGSLANQVFNSDGGFPGTNGNIDQDPLFVDQLLGDLRLLPGSPCIDTADMVPALDVVTDHVEASRILDHDLDGVALPDMGAFELGAVHLTKTGGPPQVGNTLSFFLTGGSPGVMPSGLVIFGVGLLDASPVFADPFGFLTVGDLATTLFIGPLPASVTITVILPPATAGVDVGVQALFGANIPAPPGNLTNLHRLSIFQ